MASNQNYVEIRITVWNYNFILWSDEACRWFEISLDFGQNFELTAFELFRPNRVRPVVSFMSNILGQTGIIGVLSKGCGPGQHDSVPFNGSNFSLSALSVKCIGHEHTYWHVLNYFS